MVSLEGASDKVAPIRLSGIGAESLEPVPFKMNRNNALTFYSNALLNPKSASHFLESALGANTGLLDGFVKTVADEGHVLDCCQAPL